MNPQFFFTDANTTPWRKSSVAEGVEVKDLGTANGRSMQLVRIQPGTSFPDHVHAGPEFVFLLEGDAVQNGQAMTAGWASAAETGTEDQNFHTHNGCVFLTVYSE